MKSSEYEKLDWMIHHDEFDSSHQKLLLTLSRSDQIWYTLEEIQAAASFTKDELTTAIIDLIELKIIITRRNEANDKIFTISERIATGG